MNHLLDLIPYVGVLSTLAFLIFRYARYSKWEDTDAGRAFMGMMACLMALVLYAFAGLLGLPDPWRGIARLVVIGGIWAALTYLARVVVRSQGGFHRDKPLSQSRQDAR